MADIDSVLIGEFIRKIVTEATVSRRKEIMNLIFDKFEADNVGKPDALALLAIARLIFDVPKGYTPTP